MRFSGLSVTQVMACAIAAHGLEITLYTNHMCPYAQRTALALQVIGVPYKSVNVNLYGSSGFTKKGLKQLESEAGLEPKGYVPVLQLESTLIRESRDCVLALAEHFPILQPQRAADALIALCDGPLAHEGRRLVESGSRSSALFDDCLRSLDDALQTGDSFLAGDTFSVADCCLLPFLLRIHQGPLDIPADYRRLRSYIVRLQNDPNVATTMPRSWWWWW